MGRSGRWWKVWEVELPFFLVGKIVGNNDTVDGAEIWLTTWEV